VQLALDEGLSMGEARELGTDLVVSYGGGRSAWVAEYGGGKEGGGFVVTASGLGGGLWQLHGGGVA
jgi:hypothetical protein